MKFLALKSLIIIINFISISFSHSSDELDIKNIVINKHLKNYNNVIFKDEYYNDIDLDNFRGKLLILNFWATWCAPCKKEMPSLDRLQSNKKLNNLKIFPINVGHEKLIKSKDFFNKTNIKNLNIYFDSSNKLPEKFSIYGLPTTVLINKNGQEFARILGTIDFNDKKFLNWLMKYN